MLRLLITWRKHTLDHHLWDRLMLKLKETLKDLDYTDKITASINRQAKAIRSY